MTPLTEVRERLAQLHERLYRPDDYDVDWNSANGDTDYAAAIEMDVNWTIHDIEGFQRDVEIGTEPYLREDRSYATKWAFRNWWLAKHDPKADHTALWLRHCGWRERDLLPPTTDDLVDVTLHRVDELLVIPTWRDEFKDVMTARGIRGTSALRHFITDLYIEFWYAADRYTGRAKDRS